ncbi:PEP-CTERM sorting domain-containing protein [Botrimarina mediterranea]|uniref:PEP-CTERM sorting domain-containing protein n=1 Tax=Botrimarina mediterranea TaxID=2528022 RepID=UPI0011887E32|nr:hypothetical protein K2D_17830 [Planctomycetes bacterium K2D]
MKIGTLSRAAFALVCGASLCGVAPAVNVVLLNEDFESYSDTSAMKAVWSINGADNGTLVDETYTQFVSLDDIEPRPIGAQAFPEGGKGVEHLGLGVLELDLAALNGGSPLVPTASQSIVLEGDIFDVGALGNKRLAVGIRNTSPAENIIEAGLYNGDPSGYQYRGILFPSTVENPNPNWAAWELPIELDRVDDADEIVTIADIGQAWHNYRVTVTPETVTYEIDLKRDGINAATGEAGYDGTITYELASTAGGYNSVRFGGPSNVSSLGNGFYGGAIFDNIKVSLVDAAAEPLVGDFNGDGAVDAADYTVWRDTLNTSVTAGTGADANENGIIDGPGAGSDYEFWATNYGATSTPAAAASVTIPEPTSLALVALGLVAVARRR